MDTRELSEARRALKKLVRRCAGRAYNSYIDDKLENFAYQQTDTLVNQLLKFKEFAAASFSNTSVPVNHEPVSHPLPLAIVNKGRGRERLRSVQEGDGVEEHWEERGAEREAGGAEMQLSAVHQAGERGAAASTARPACEKAPGQSQGNVRTG